MSLTNNTGGVPFRVHPGLRSGRVYLPPELGMPGVACRTNIGAGASSYANDTVYYIPMYIPHRCTLVELSICVRAYSGGPYTWDAGIYTNNNGIAGTLIGSCGSQSHGATGVDPVTVAIPLDAGWYWQAFVTNTAYNVTNWSLEVYTERTSNYDPAMPLGRPGNNTTTNTTPAPYLTEASATLPATATSTPTFAVSSLIRPVAVGMAFS